PTAAPTSAATPPRRSSSGASAARSSRSRSEATASEAWHPELSPAPLIRGLWSIRRGGSAKSAESPRCIDHKRSVTARPRFGPRRPIPVSGRRQEGGGVEIFPTPPTPWHARSQVPVAERFTAAVLRITRRGGPSVRARRVRAAGRTRAAVRGTGGANTTAGRTGVAAGVRGTRGLVEVALAEHSRGRIPTAEAEGQGRCRGTADDHCAEGEVDDR